MANKPTVLPRWATDGTNNDEPTSGRKDTGFPVNAVPTSDEFNWYMNSVWRWVEFLNSGSLDFGDTTTLQVGTVKCNTIEPIIGNVAVDGDLAATSLTAGVLDMSGGIIYHGPRKLIIGAADFQLVNDDGSGAQATLSSDMVWSFGGTAQLAASVPIPEGRRLTTAVWRYNRGGAGNITLSVLRASPGSVSTALNTITISAGNGWTSETRGSIQYVMGSDSLQQVFLLVQGDNIANKFGYVELTFDNLSP